MVNEKKKYTISKEKIWNARKPKFNGYAIGYGPHGDTKYNRQKNKQDFYKQLEQDK